MLGTLLRPDFDSSWMVLVHLGIRACEDFLADRRPTIRETEMPYFKPFPVADESALKRFGGRAQTVVRRCTRTTTPRSTATSMCRA
jgi:hypothetical protein